MSSLASSRPTASTPVATQALYVVDGALRVILAGPSPVDLAEPQAARDRLPADFEAPLADLLTRHDFDRQPIASATISSEIALRCMRSAGPAGAFYMVMAGRLPQALQAVA